MPTPYFEVAHLTKHFSTDESTVAAIQDVSFSLQKGQFLSILGPSGCGKSTLFNLIAGLMQPDCGDIRLQGESMLLRPGLTGYMLQKDLLLPWRTIADNIVLPKTLHGTRRQAALKSAVSDIAACGLRDLLNRRPDECSGGQRQRAALVRTLQTGMPGTGNQLRITKAVIIKKYSKSASLCQCRLDKNDIWFMPVLFSLLR